MTASPEAHPLRTVRLAAEIALIVLLLGVALWDVRWVLQPLVVFPLLACLLWPTHTTPLGRRTLVVLCLVFACWFIATMGGVLMPFAIALAIAYLLAPAVGWLVARKVRRGLAIALVLVPFFGLIVGLVLVLVPEIEQQLLELAGRVPELASRLAQWAMDQRTRLAANGGAGLLTDVQVERLQHLQTSDLVGLVSDKWDQIANHLWDALLGLGRGVSAGLGMLLTIIGYFVVAPIVSAYLLAEWPDLIGHCEALVPPSHRAALFGFLREYDVMLGRFIRGQLTEATLVAVLTTGGLALLGFPGAVLIGVIAGLGNLIPTVGLFLSVIPGLLIALTAPAIGTALLKLIVVFAVVQIIDGSITGPRIVGGSVGLSPVWVMMAVLVFGNLLGFAGMFLAVPLAAFVKLLAVRAVRRFQASELYAGR